MAANNATPSENDYTIVRSLGFRTTLPVGVEGNSIKRDGRLTIIQHRR
jgi:hypothetical protein